jgi:hypothetical protein
MGRSRSRPGNGNHLTWRSSCDRRPVSPTLVFVAVPEAKTVKNRLHLDLRPVNGVHEAEVERLLVLGARRADVGQGDVPWVVLADPEGNEFCVLGSRAAPI